MTVSILTLVMMVAVAAISTSFGLKRNLYLHKIRSEGEEHLLDHIVRPNADNLASNFSWQMPVSQMPGKADKLIRIPMPDFDDRLRSRLNLEPSPIFKSEAIAIRHRNRFREVEEDVFTLIRGQANAAAIACIIIEGKSACRFPLRPKAGAAMKQREVHRHVST